ncbi:holo-(acyl-carrier-protein) synthase [Desulfovibrionales bacterium]
MIVGLGVDLVELSRIKRAWKHFGRAFAMRILGPNEMAGLDRHPQQIVSFLAARFAAKEATAKALGTGFTQQVHFHDLQITYNALGKPELVLSGHALVHATALDVTRTHISLTHDNDTAVAVVVLES